MNAPVEEQTGGITTYDLTKEEIGRVYKEHAFSDRVTQIFQNTMTMELGDYLAEKSIDLAIVDACHDTSYVINDFHKVMPFVREGGAVLLHDTHPSMIDHLQGSYVACLRLRRAGYDIRHIDGSWWGIWIKGNGRTLEAGVKNESEG